MNPKQSRDTRATSVDGSCRACLKPLALLCAQAAPVSVAAAALRAASSLAGGARDALMRSLSAGQVRS